MAFAEAYRRFGDEPMVVPETLREIYRDTHPFQVVMKPAQVGVTEANLLRGLHSAYTGFGGSGRVLYLTSTQEMANRLSQERLARAAQDSPALAELLKQTTPGIGMPQRIQVRTVGQGTIFFSGTESATQYSGIDAPFVIVDEYDLAGQDVLSQAIARTRAAPEQRVLVTSTPTIPSFGIHALIERSDERHRELCCAACGRWSEPEFPDTVDFDQLAIVCSCGAPFPPDAEGRWVPRRPEVTEIRGYVLNRLTLPNPPIEQMRLAAAGTLGTRQEEFHRLDLGVPYVSSTSRLTAEQLLAVSGPVPGAARYGPKKVAMGVDVGGDHFWVVVRHFYGGQSYLVFAERVVGGWDEIGRLCERFDVKWCAVDALPDQRGARAFQREARKLRSRPNVFRVFYNRQTEHDYPWGEYAEIHAARTLAIDEMMDAIRRGQARLPEDVTELDGGRYFAHMQALVRVMEPDDFGQAIPRYQHTRDDDFAHAETFISLMAEYYGRWHRWWE